MNDRFMKNFNGEKVFSLEYDKETLKDMVLEKQDEIERLNNIIKEVREYIENNSYFKDNTVKTMILGDYSNGILEILDKADKGE